jgi:hypothetical protein
MNWDRVEGDWKQFKGRIKEKWAISPTTTWTELPVAEIS